MVVADGRLLRLLESLRDTGCCMDGCSRCRSLSLGAHALRHGKKLLLQVCDRSKAVSALPACVRSSPCELS